MGNAKGRLAISRAAARRVVNFYVLISSIWIIGSDGLVYFRGGVSEASTLMSIGKGLLFVLVTALLLFLFMTRWVHASQREKEILHGRLAQLSRFANDIVLLFDEQGQVIDANDRAVEAYGYPLETLLGLNLSQINVTEEGWQGNFSTVRQNLHVRFEAVHKRSNGETFPVEVSSRLIRDGEGDGIIQSIIRDITERKEAERQIIHLKDVYAALSQTNQCIVRVAERDELFATVCDIAVKFGHFRMATIVEVDEATKDIVPVFAAGGGLDVFDGLRRSADPDSPWSEGVASRAIISGEPCVVKDLVAELKTRPLLDHALRFGFKSAAAFPLNCRGRAVGALALYSAEVAFFTDELMALLKEMALDISYALSRMEDEAERRRLVAELAQTDIHIRGIIESSADAIVTTDTDLRLLFCNENYKQFFRTYTGREVEIGRGVVDFLDEQSDRDAILQRWQRALAGETFNFEWQLSEGKEPVYLVSRYGPLWDADGRLIGAFHIGRDISEHKRMEFELRKLWMAVEQSPVSIIITDYDGAIQYVNPAFLISSGYALDEVVGRNPRFLSAGHTPQDDYKKMWSAIKKGTPWYGSFCNKRKDGSLYWEEVVVAPVRDDKGAITQFLGIKQDVTKRREAEANAEFLAQHDPLTKLPNRLLGRDRMERAIVAAERQHSKAALFIVNIDRFKRVNDSLGHSFGDALLQALIQRLKACIRETDTLSRQGGDEFLIILAAVDDPETINRVGAQILEKMVSPFSIDGIEISVTVSIGIAVYPEDGLDFEALLRQADIALSQAKEAGRNTYRFFAEKMNLGANEYVQILNGLRRALKQGEFVLHYQPQFDLTDNEIIGAEALIRWKHPKLGLIPPGRFIAIAEESGLIVDIGAWVLKEACRQAAAWRSEDWSAVVVAVNLSAVQFKRGDLLQSVSEALEESGLDSDGLELELTESILIKDTANVMATVKQLKTLGVKLSIDDFGTGYSSLAYLRLLDLDKLKIDQSFVRGIALNPDDDTIVRAIVQMAQGLGLKTIAEGVEDWDTLVAIRNHGCDEVQGYFFAKPMTAKDFTAFLAERAKVKRLTRLQ